MQHTKFEQPVVDFYTYPPVGGDDWRYVRQTALVRVYETQMLTKTILTEMANAESFESAADLLSATEYAVPRAGRDFAQVEEVFRARRNVVRQLFADLMLDKSVVELFRARDDFANVRLAVRRALTQRPLGADYSSDGNFPPEQFEKVFEQEDYAGTAALPDYLQQATERAVLAYYQGRDPALREQKDIRQIDYAIDWVQAEYNLKSARRLKSIFLLGFFRIQIDLTNIRTMLRLKFAESEHRNVFLKGGYIELERLQRSLELGYEALGPLFFVTPYYEVVESGANYLASNKSFLRLEQRCDEHLLGFLKTTIQVIAGPQPIIAYFLMKENEIRTVRLILTAKKNHLDTRLILDRMA